ncbi:MAG: hypothetical protein WD688_02860 [Candidatus Binatia bacterium]
MAKHNSATLDFDDSAQKIISVVEPVQSGAKTKLSGVIALLLRYVCGQHRRQIEESYISRKSRKDESRLEFQRFLYW